MIFSQKFKKNLFALPIIIFGSNKKIFIFLTFAAKHNGKDIYPPVEIKISIFSLFNKNKDFKVKKNTFMIAKGSKINLFNLGVLTTKTL